MSGPDRLDMSTARWNATPKEGLEAASKRAGIAGTEASTARTTQLTPAQVRVAAAQAAALEAKNAAAADAAAHAADASAEAQGRFRDNVVIALQQLQRVRDLAGPTSAGYGALMKDLPASRAKELDAAIQAVRGNTFLATLADLKSGSKTGSTGVGRVLQSEVPFFVDRFGQLKQERQPSGLVETSNDIETALRRMYARANGAGPQLDSPDADTRSQAMLAYGIVEPGQPRAPALAPVVYAESEGKMGLLKPGEQTKSVAIPPAMQSEFTDYAMAHMGKFDPAEYAAFRSSLDQKYGFGSSPAQMATYREEANTLNKGAKQGSSINLQIPATTAAATEYEKMRTDIGANPIAGRAEAAMAGAVPAFLGPLTPASWNPKLAALQETYPGAAMAGKIGAGVGQMMLAPGLSKANPVAFMGAQGAWSGAGEHPEDRLTGAVEGGITGAAFGKGAEALGAVARGLPNIPVPLMAKYGVPTTVGDVTSGLVKKYIEPALTKLPGVGSTLRARQTEALHGFNKAAFTDALSDINITPEAIGPSGIAHAQDAVSQAYKDALQGITVTPTPEFLSKVAGAIVSVGKAEPKYGKLLETELRPLLNKPELSGEDFQLLLQKADKVSRTAMGNPASGWYEYVRPHTNAVKDAAIELLDANGLDTVAGTLAKANKAYRKVGILSDAVTAHLPEGGVITPDTLLKSVVSNVEKFEGPNALARGETKAGSALPLLDLALEGKRLALPSTPSLVKPLAAMGTLGLGDLAARSFLSDKDEHAGDIAANVVRDVALLGAASTAPVAAYSKPAQDFLRRQLLGGGRGAAQSWLEQLATKYGPEVAAQAGAAYAAPSPAPFSAPPPEGAQITQLPLPSRKGPPAGAPEDTPAPSYDALGFPVGIAEGQ